MSQLYYLLLQFLDSLLVGFPSSDPLFGTGSDQKAQGNQHEKNRIDGPEDLILGEDVVQESGKPQEKKNTTPD